ncbi:hypothetical protein K0M31_000251 [Melipona bicolor]|uniref:Uncharacterized protein n=1 Tax=Melipona bicolor TaxID=60889 RepID=A0AA40KWG7_9HYME|nr:hypothetical protein K0M31_000251 [Melipona bicolor]
MSNYSEANRNARAAIAANVLKQHPPEALVWYFSECISVRLSDSETPEKENPLRGQAKSQGVTGPLVKLFAPILRLHFASALVTRTPSRLRIHSGWEKPERISGGSRLSVSGNTIVDRPRPPRRFFFVELRTLFLVDRKWSLPALVIFAITETFFHGLAVAVGH